jgi:hypothetical protein
VEPAALQAIIDRQAIVDTIVRYAATLDAKDWAGAETCFAAEVETDYGRPPWAEYRGAPRLSRGVTSVGGWEGPCRGPPRY